MKKSRYTKPFIKIYTLNIKENILNVSDPYEGTGTEYPGLNPEE